MTLKTLSYHLMRSTYPSLTLSSRVWKHLKGTDRGLYRIRGEKRNELLGRTTSTIRFAIPITALILTCLLAMCFLTREFVDQYFSLLGFFKFTPEGAKDMITDILASSATIIGLSFVVIGFSFEVVKNATHQTLKAIFRLTRLYFVFAISIISILLLVFMTLIKHTVDPYTAGNFAIFSCFLLILTTIAIAYMFAMVISFFNQDKITILTREHLLRLARFSMLDIRFRDLSKQIYQLEMERLGLTRHNFFGRPDGPVVFTLANAGPVEIGDICLPLLSRVIARIGNHNATNPHRYEPIGNNHRLRSGQALFHFEKETRISRLHRSLLNFSLHTYTSDGLFQEYQEQKNQLEENLISASEDGDVNLVKQRLQDLSNLYSLYNH